MLIGAIMTLSEAIILLSLFRNETWFEPRSNRIVLGLDMMTGLGFLFSTFFYCAESGAFAFAASFASFTILVVMVVSHLARLNQYLFKQGPRFIKNTSMLVMNVIKIILLMGGALLSSTGVLLLS